MRLSLLPRERRFYDLFEKGIANIAAAADALQRLLAGKGDRKELQDEIKDLEHEGDSITHEIVKTLNRTFVTPFDREDIYALATDLDDIIDFIEEASGALSLYNLDTVPEAASDLGDLLLQAVRQLQKAMAKLESQKELEGHWIEVNRLENVGDEVMRKAVGQLFRGGLDPIEVMKLKDLYELLESALDRCEDVANIIENIVIKNA